MCCRFIMHKRISYGKNKAPPKIEDALLIQKDIYYINHKRTKRHFDFVK